MFDVYIVDVLHETVMIPISHVYYSNERINVSLIILIFGTVIFRNFGLFHWNNWYFCEFRFWKSLRTDSHNQKWNIFASLTCSTCEATRCHVMSSRPVSRPLLASGVALNHRLCMVICQKLVLSSCDLVSDTKSSTWHHMWRWLWQVWLMCVLNRDICATLLKFFKTLLISILYVFSYENFLWITMYVH